MTLLFVIISISILIFIHELGHFLFAKLFNMPVEEFGIGFPPRLWKKQVGETTYSIGAFPFGGFVKITGENAEDPSSAPIPPSASRRIPRQFRDCAFFQKSLVILAGVLFNILLGWIAIILLFTTGIPKHLLVSEVVKNSPAFEEGIAQGDVIQTANIKNQILQDPISPAAFIELTRKNKGEEISLTILRGKQTIEKQVHIREETREGEGRIGIHLVEIGLDAEPFPNNLIQGTITASRTLSAITQGFAELITGIFTRPEVVEGLTGPIGIIGIATQAGTLGIPYLVQLMALISLNLAVLNLIPFPALDGGRFLFLIIEQLIRRPLSSKVQTIANTAGFVILILLMVLVTIKDIAGLS